MSGKPNHCGGCGRRLDDGDHAGCQRLVALDPPRFCSACGARLDVQVFPGGYEASCRRCRRRSGRPAAPPPAPGA